MHDYLKSTRDAIRSLYFLIIGLALSVAIARLFTFRGEFFLPSIQTIMLFIVFCSFISRFFLGAYYILSFDVELECKGAKVIIDALAFFIQALAFYAYALNFNNLAVAQWSLIVICGVDFVWLAILASLFKIAPATLTEWLLHDIFMVTAIALNLWFIHSILFLLVCAIVGAGFDFAINYNFYFSLKTKKGLRIFVAGPYKDPDPKKIELNVQAANDIGKKLVLRGHFPFIPHTMLHGWEADETLKEGMFKELDYKWLEFCDALFYIGSSKGADIEKEIATHKGLQIFTKIKDVPDVRTKTD